MARSPMFGEVKSEGLHALDAFEKLGATNDAGFARRLLRELDASANEKHDRPWSVTKVSSSKKRYPPALTCRVHAGSQNLSSNTVNLLGSFGHKLPTFRSLLGVER